MKLPSSNDPAVQEVLDREAIRDCLYRYCRGIDRCDEATLLSAYWPGAIDDHVFFKGPVEKFVKFALPFLRGRSGRWLTGFGLLLAGLTVAPVRGTASLPLVASAFLVSATIAWPLVPWRRLRERAAAPRRNPQLHS